MGTNYYRILPLEIVESRRKKLINQITKMELTPANIEIDFRIIDVNDIESMSPWDEFMDGMKVHLGKRSSGWQFLWNFHDNKYYSNKEELLSFIKRGQVVNEYGEEMDVDEFIEMALNWGQPDGKYVCKEYFEEQRKLYPNGTFFDHPDYYDLNIDGLRVSRHTEFS